MLYMRYVKNYRRKEGSLLLLRQLFLKGWIFFKLGKVCISVEYLSKLNGVTNKFEGEQQKQHSSVFPNSLNFQLVHLKIKMCRGYYVLFKHILEAIAHNL